MPTVKVTRAAGLNTSDNVHASPDGSAAVADNVVVPFKDVYEPRRGQNDLGYSYSDSNDRTDEIAFYGTTAILAKNDGSNYELAHDTGSALTTKSGTYTPADNTTLRMKFMEAKRRLFFTTSNGIYTLDSATGTPSQAGAPQAPDIIQYFNTSPLIGNPDSTGSWLPKNSQVSYRWQLGVEDANGDIRWGPPSGRHIIVNPADATVSLTLTSNVVTATSSTTHNFKVGDIINVDTGATIPSISNAQILSVPTSTTFTYAHTHADAGPEAGHTATSGTKQVELTMPLRSTWAGYRVRVGRTLATASASIVPDDEHFVLHQGLVSSTDASGGFYHNSTTSNVYRDYVPEAGLSTVPFETNPRTGDGIDQASYDPPYAKDITHWNDRAWFANTSRRHFIEMRLLGVGSPDGLQTNDTITFGGKTFTAITGSSSGYSYQYTSVRSISQNIVDSVHSLIERSTANDFSGNLTVKGYYLSDDNDPGVFVLETDNLSDSTFYVSASRPESWSPKPPKTWSINAASLVRASNVVTATTTANHDLTTGQQIYVSSNSPEAAFPVGLKTVASTPAANQFTYSETASNATSGQAYKAYGITTASSNDRYAHRLYYSKLQQPDAVPLLNYIDVGYQNAAILRIVPLKDRLYVFKEDGIFVVTGEAPFRVDLLDATAKVIAPDSVQVVSNRIFALTTQGFIMVTESGVALISRPIDYDLNELVSLGNSDFKRATFGVGYETEHQYLCWLPSSTTGTVADQAYVYNIFSNAWTRRTDTQRCARVSPTGYLYTGLNSRATITKERKSFDYETDYADRSFTVSWTTGGLTSVVLSSATGVNVGDYLDSGGSAKGWITALNGTTATIDNSSGVAFSNNSSGTLYNAIVTTLTYRPQTLGAPGVAKHFQKVALHFGTDTYFNYGYLNTATELSTTATSEALVVTSGAPGNKDPLLWVPLEKRRASELSIGFSLSQARKFWRLYGYSLTAQEISEKVSR